ncbi:MAG: DNA methyltransferase [Acidobacteriota bacterium]
MLHVEQLQWLADNNGFETHLKFSGDAIDVCIASVAFNPEDRFTPVNTQKIKNHSVAERNLKLLREAAVNLSNDGLMFVYGLPSQLARYAVALADLLTFRYWVAVRTATKEKAMGLRPEHTGLLLLSKPGAPINKLRMSHSMCKACGKTLKDWGGKSHLMNPQGVMLSDVWMDLIVDGNDQMPAEIFERILQLSLSVNRKQLLLLSLDERPLQFSLFQEAPTAHPLHWQKPKPQPSREIPKAILNTMHKGKCLEVLKKIPSQTVDLAFADPPFNLTKTYNGYTDALEQDDYTGWCKRWLIEYERVLKPGGALVVLNLPKWSFFLADFLCRSKHLYLQNWIVWNALPEPKGILMPAHYTLLYFTKGKTPSRFNYCSMEEGWQPFVEAVFPPDRADVCKRRVCIRKRRASASTWRGELTDIWYDIPRDRRAGRRSSSLEIHPCPTPEALIDRIIRLTTNGGDVVLDAFAGVGTTALVAQRLGRNFVTIEQDTGYNIVAEKRIGERQLPLPQAKPRKTGTVTKRKLQLELKRIAVALNRVPTRTDIETYSQYKIEQYESVFASWGEALKAAKIFARSPENLYELFDVQTQEDLFAFLDLQD